MEYAIPIGLIEEAGLAFFWAFIGIALWMYFANAARRRKHKEQLSQQLKVQRVAQARQFMEKVKGCKALAPVDTNLILHSGESAFYSASSALYETRAVRHYQSGSTGFRVAKGIYVGATRGRSVSSQEWSCVDTGQFTVTSKRLIFDGGMANRTVPLSKVLSVQQSGLSHVEISVEDRQKSMVFEVDNPLIVAAVILICRQADPLDLSQTNLDITFE